MPMYDYKCSKCNQIVTAMRSIAERENGPICCEKPTQKQLSAPRLQPVIGGGSFEGYKCVVSDEYVTSRKQRREIMAKHNIQEVD